MVINVGLKDDFGISLNLIESNINEIEQLFSKNDILSDPQYKQWYQSFKIIYNEQSANPRLYITHSILYSFGLAFIDRFLLNKLEANCLYEDKLEFPNLKLEYFTPLLKVLKNEHEDSFQSLIFNLIKFCENKIIIPEYFFDYIIQNIISPAIRHKSGEFFTPPFLVKKMVKEAYSFGESVLDPCCGSGNFLIEIINTILASDKTEEEKISALNNLHGYDINPISIFLSTINFLYLFRNITSNLNINLFVLDSLFPDNSIAKNQFDLIISNPPWYTFRDIESMEYQEDIKELADNLEIKPLPKNVLNIEISSLFFYQSKEKYMKSKAKIFFVITKGVINGSHASRFRNFIGFQNLKIWGFNSKVESIFNINFICLFAEKSDRMSNQPTMEFPAHIFTVNADRDNINYFDNIELKEEILEFLVPYAVEKKGNKSFVKKLISKELNKDLLPNKESIYKDLFHKGADLNPRNLIFVSTNFINDSNFKINPDKRIFKRAKQPWTKEEFKDQIVEKQYIFNVLKSTELVKFAIYDSYQVFLPLTANNLNFNYNELKENAKIFYDTINAIYLRLKKATTKNDSLMDNLNRWAKLINERQLSNIKVVYNNSGSVLNSAVIQGNYLITGDLSFYATDDINKAYYLTAILNSPLMTRQIKIKKSSRHIFKIPFDTPIKKYNLNDPNHQKLAKLGMKCHEIVKSALKVIKDKRDISKVKLQNTLKLKLAPELSQIDKILLREFN